MTAPPLARAARAISAELTAAKVFVEAVDASHGPRIASFVVAVRSSQCVTRALQAAPRLATVLGDPNVRVSNHGFKVIVEMPLPKRYWLSLSATDVQGDEGLRIYLGDDPRGFPVPFHFGTDPHLGVYGRTGSGKSEALRLIVWQLAMQNAPDRLALVLIDGLARGLTPFAALPHLIHPVVTDPAAAGPVFAALLRELDVRRTNLARCARPLVIVVDEVAQVIEAGGGIDGAAGKAMCRIAATGRGLGVHVVVATQHPTREVIGRLVQANVAARLCGAVADDAAARLIMGSDRSDPRTLTGAGDMLLVWGDGVRRVQVAMVTPDELATLPTGGPSEGLDVWPAPKTVRQVHTTQVPTEVAPDEVVAVLSAWHQTGREPGVKVVEGIVRGVSGTCGARRAERVKDVAARTRRGLIDAGLLIGGGDGR